MFTCLMTPQNQSPTRRSSEREPADLPPGLVERQGRLAPVADICVMRWLKPAVIAGVGLIALGALFFWLHSDSDSVRVVLEHDVAGRRVARLYAKMYPPNGVGYYRFSFTNGPPVELRAGSGWSKPEELWGGDEWVRFIVPPNGAICRVNLVYTRLPLILAASNLLGAEMQRFPTAMSWVMDHSKGPWRQKNVRVKLRLPAESHNEITGANAGGPPLLPMRTRWAARIALFSR